MSSTVALLGIPSPDPEALAKFWSRVSSCKSQKICFHCRHNPVHVQYLGVCSSCQRKLPKTRCKHCNEELVQHQMICKAEAFFGRTVCLRCAQMLERYGLPKRCEYCRLWSAFAENLQCSKCVEFEKLYGPPSPCEMCGVQGAFRREADKMKKVENKLLCFSCTVQFKSLKRQRENSNSTNTNNNSQESSSSRSKTQRVNNSNASSPAAQADAHSRWDIGGPTSSPEDAVQNSTTVASSQSSRNERVAELEAEVAKLQESYQKLKCECEEVVVDMKNQLKEKDNEIVVLNRRIETERTNARRCEAEAEAQTRKTTSIIDDLEQQRKNQEEQILALKVRKEDLEKQQRERINTVVNVRNETLEFVELLDDKVKNWEKDIFRKVESILVLAQVKGPSDES